MFKRRLKLVLKVLLASFVLLFVFLLFERVRGQVSLTRYKRALMAQGEILDINKLTPPPDSSTNNGAPELLRLATMLPEDSSLRNYPPPRMRLVAAGKAMVGFREEAWVDDKKTNSWGTVASALATNRQILAEARAALERPKLVNNLDYSRGWEMLLPHLSKDKYLCFCFVAQAQLALRNGNNQEALDNLLASADLLKALENDHVLISELVRGAIAHINLEITWEALQAGPWTGEQLRQLQQAWEKNTFITNLVSSLEGERLLGESTYDKLSAADLNVFFGGGMRGIGDSRETLSWWNTHLKEKPPREELGLMIFEALLSTHPTRNAYCHILRFAWLAQDEERYLRVMQQLIQVARAVNERKSTTEIGGLLDRLNDTWRLRNGYDFMRFSVSWMLLESTPQQAGKVLRSETARSLSITAIALKRYELHYHQPAPNLRALVPDFISAVPTDYLDGQPIKYRMNPDGTGLLYSVGEDGKDDGGNPALTDAKMEYRWIWSGKDAVWPSLASQEEIETWRKNNSKN